jgi:uncharacterized membrane protein YoaK (UPF0700 family)
MPLVGLLVSYVQFALSKAVAGSHQGNGVDVVLLLFAILCVVGGVVCAIVGMKRRERFSYLPITGLILSLGILASYFAA